MKLRDRLSARGPAHPRPVARSRLGRGWAQTRWTAPVTTPLAGVLGPAAVPRGMETLSVPDAAEVAAALRVLEGPAAKAAVDARRPVVVLDIETSGLGACLVPFMAAVAWHERGQVHLLQWTLHDPAAERAFLADVFGCLDEVLRPGTRLLSYNGKSFDLPRLRVRAQRLALGGGAGGKGVPSLSAAHLDLVIPARRVLKGSLPNCRLSTLEVELLGHRRRGDMAGLEIAELWERMAATPGLADALADDPDDEDLLDPFIREDLAAAQLHNRGDVWALCSVATAVAGRLQQPRGLAEAVGAATHLRQIEATAAATAVLRPMIEAGRAGSAWADAALLLADLHRAEGEHEAAAVLWQRVCDACPGHVRAHDALAKHLEHRKRRPDLALAVAAASKAPCPRRIARLQKKVAALEV